MDRKPLADQRGAPASLLCVGNDHKDIHPPRGSEGPVSSGYVEETCKCNIYTETWSQLRFGEQPGPRVPAPGRCQEVSLPLRRAFPHKLFSASGSRADSSHVVPQTRSGGRLGSPGLEGTSRRTEEGPSEQ